MSKTDKLPPMVMFANPASGPRPRNCSRETFVPSRVSHFIIYETPLTSVAFRDVINHKRQATSGKSRVIMPLRSWIVRRHRAKITQGASLSTDAPPSPHNN